MLPPLRESPERMKKYYENQFFLLVFSDYDRINESKPPRQVSEVLKHIEEAIDFKDLQQMLTANPIAHKPYADFLASLTERVDSIEKLRNCVAHNRLIPEKTLEDYKKVKDPLLKSIEEFLDSQEGDESEV